MVSKSAEKVAADLGRAGYHGLFLAGDRNVASTIWRAGDNRPGLTEIVASDNFAGADQCGHVHGHAGICLLPY